MAADELEFNEAIGILVDYSLIKRTAAGLQIHRLIQGAILARHPGPSLADAASGVTWMASQSTPGNVSPLVVVLAMLRADAPATIMGAPQDWPRWAVLLPHALAATNHLDPVPSPQMAAGDDAAWLLDRAATYLQVHARLQEARPLAERALAITEAAYGPHHPDVGTNLSNLAHILRRLGLAQEARPLAERALAITEAAYGPHHPDVGTGLSNLALILRRLGLPQEARPLAERAVGITEAAYGPDHPAVAIRLSNLATILQDLGLAQEARPLAERAAAITEAAYGPDHPTVAADLNNLTLILRSLGMITDS